jgi:hypothetical protein
MVAAAGAIAFWLSRLNRMDALADRIDHGGTHLERLQRILSETLADPELTLTVGGGAGGADGMVVATLAGEVAVQSRALRDEPLLRAPIREAIVLSYAHEHLRGMLASTLGSTQAAGRRLLVADDVQRAALADRILSGPVPLLERAHQELALSGTTAVEPALLRLELATGELRSFGEGVLPPLASGVDLAVALRSLASTMPGSLVVELTTVPVAADQVVAQTLYYVCAEALANVMRHSGATQVDIELTDNAQGIALSVRDNGLGVTGDPRQGSSGLAGLADRLRILGGRLELEDRPGGGAALVAEVPR